jgi:hypothetical protein
MKKEQIKEGMGSVNVEQQYDISRIQKLAGIANASTVAGTKVQEQLSTGMSNEEATELADDLQHLLQEMSTALESMENLVRSSLPNEYRSMEAYTFAHIKTSLGGYGYADRMSKSVESLIEDLREYAEGGEEE